MRQPVCTVVGALAGAMATVGLAVRYVHIHQHIVLLLATASPFLMVGGPVSVVLLTLSRRWLVTTIACCLTIAILLVQLPRYLGPNHARAETVPIRVMTVNLGLGLADATAVNQSARDHADVLVVQELTPDAIGRLSAAGLDQKFRFRALVPHGFASGVGVWSRYAVAAATPIGGYALPLLKTRIRVPGVVVDPTVVSAHMAAPWPQPIADWHRDLTMFPATLKELADQAGAGAVIVAGDFNSTMDMRPFRHLLSDGYRDAAEQAGAGLTRSYPNRSWLPPLLGIDHVLVYKCTATSARTVRIPGSDHRGLVVAVDVPRDLTATAGPAAR